VADTVPEQKTALLPHEALEAAWLAWRPGAPPTRWQEFLPGPGQTVSPEAVFLLLQLDLEFRAKAGLPGLLEEQHFHHPRLSAQDAGVGPERQVELVQWEYQQRWRRGHRACRADYVAAFPELAVLLGELRVRWDCPQCRRKGIVLEDDRAEQVRCPGCQAVHAVVDLFPLVPWATLCLPAGSPLASRYDLLEEVGRGGMGVVYRARHKALDMRVAVKVLLPGAPLQRFLREAKLLAKVKSPYVVSVHDFDALPDGRPLLVMEWVQGHDLREAMKTHGGQLAEETALVWMRHTSEGMLTVAEQGIIHRDLKPSNILIDGQGHARVADFGLARGLFSQGEPSLYGSVMGTPLYMAPEQAEDPRGVDTRADIYSFGATFYHALTGGPPFTGETPFAVLFKHKTEPLVSPRARNPALSEHTSELLERCLAKSPSDRFASFADILKQLQAVPGTPSPWQAMDDADLADFLKRYQARRQVYLSTFSRRVREVDTYEFGQGRKLLVMGGDLVEQQADALVSSNTSFLNMNVGVSLALRNAAGPGYGQEVLRLAPVLPGRAVVTSGGALRARFVFHGVTVGVDALNRLVFPSRDLLSEIMTSCFYHADTLGVKTMAFPLLGTGGAGFSKPVCLDTMFRFLARMLLRGLTRVCEVRIIIFE
jgi:serine/threonine protein kinase